MRKSFASTPGDLVAEYNREYGGAAIFRACDFTFVPSRRGSVGWTGSYIGVDVHAALDRRNKQVLAVRKRRLAAAEKWQDNYAAKLRQQDIDEAEQIKDGG